MNLLQNTKKITIYSGVDGATSTTTVDKLKALYEKSGSTKTFSEWLIDLKKSQNKSNTPIIDWLQSDSAKKAIDTAQNLVKTYQSGKSGNGGVAFNVEPEDTNEGGGFGETTILGMTPITFGIVTVSVLVVGFLATRYVLNHMDRKG